MRVWDLLVAYVLLSEWDVLDQHGRLGAEKDSQHSLKDRSQSGSAWGSRPGEIVPVLSSSECHTKQPKQFPLRF